MSGVAVIQYLLSHSAPLIAVVPAVKIKGGVLPLNTVLPGISVQEVDSFPRLPVNMTGTARFITERVQVTVLAKTYPSKKGIMELVRKALPLSRDTINGIMCDSVLPESVGPDIDDPETQIYTQSRDYIVRWSEQG